MARPTPCLATTRFGEPCRFSARKATGFCVNHDPSYAQQQRKNARKGGRHSMEARLPLAIPLDSINLSDRASVQALLDAVVRLELLGALPSNRVRNLIRALSVAARNLAVGGFGGTVDRYWEVRTALDDFIAHLPPQDPTHD